MSKTSSFVAAESGFAGELLHVEPKAFLRGGYRGSDPIVTLVVRSPAGEIAAAIDLTPTDAHVLSERLRQEAELASVIEAENSAGQKKEEYQA